MHQLWILDACHSGTLQLLKFHNESRFEINRMNFLKKSSLMTEVAPASVWHALAHRPSIIVVAGGGEDEECCEMEGRGVFTRRFCEALRTHRKQEKATTTISEIFQTARKKVFQDSQQLGSLQLPVMLRLPKHRSSPCSGEYLFLSPRKRPLQLARNGQTLPEVKTPPIQP